MRAEKLSSEGLNRGKFQKRISFGFLFGQSSKKSKSSESSEHSSGSSAESVSSHQTFRSSQPSRLGTSPLALLSEEDLCQKDVPTMTSFI